MKEITTDDLKKMSDEERLPFVMEALEEILPLVPVDTLRSYVASGESIIGKGSLPLPSGQAFDQQTRKGRLWLDLIDALEELDKEYR